ncbi:MAG: hypothetical protein YK1312THETA_1910008 [Marine Group I thaumarchaeote]|nr:MAG: hypothetical protein YK1312THETA_1910008 [Marine Group I thaumarchaeote]
MIIGIESKIPAITYLRISWLNRLR